MSLYFGKLSERVCRDELERVFGRFGHCNVQVKKEGYGFVVFDFRSDAEKALRELKGRKICGELLTLMWSKQQPESHFAKFDRGGERKGNTYELQGKRIFDRLGERERKEGFDGWEKWNHNTDIVERGESVEEGEYCRDGFKYCDGEKKNRRRDFPDEGGHVVPNQGRIGRGAEPTHGKATDCGNGNTLEFDRYKPSCGYDRKDDKEDYSSGSLLANSQENVGRAQIGEETLNRPNSSKLKHTGYRRGEAGHKMQNCRKEHSLRRKYNRLDDEHADKIDKKRRVEDDIESGWGSWVIPQSNGDALLMSHQRDKWRVSGSRNDCAPFRNESSLVAKDTEEYEGKKQSRNETESPKRSREKKISRRSVSSSLLSDYSAFRSLTHSQSSKSLPRSTKYSRSRSVSSRAHSSSSKSVSSSKSQNCRGKKLHSMRSSSPTSLSVSLNQSFLSSTNKIQLNSKNSSTNGAALKSVDHLVARGQGIDSTMELENLQTKDSDIAVNGQAVVSTTAVDATVKDQHVQEDNNKNLTKPVIAEKLSPRRVKWEVGFQHPRTLMADDIPTEVQKPTLETHITPRSGCSTIISIEEMCMVLSKSGLELPEGHEIKLTTDDFFGAARLWPWYIIYYRRLKKGPISIENYARRVAQNQEFGIVDKYIRSSSGWGEFSPENS